MNKITIEHYRVFWGITRQDTGHKYLDKVVSRLIDFGFMAKRRVEVIETIKIDRIYRIALKVEAASLCDIVGLSVNRKPADPTCGGLFS